MASIDLPKLASDYESELLDRVIPFWLEKSPDRACGGYFTCLDREGRVFDTDKFVWLQARQVWTFAMLYNRVERRSEWLDMALLGAEFLRKHGHDASLDWYFSLTRDGRPLVQPYNIFSNAFAAMAFGQLSLASGKDEHAEIARRTWDRILVRRDNPKGIYNKAVPGTRDLKSFSLPMILCNLAQEIEHLLPPGSFDEIIETALHEVMEVFFQPESGLIVEYVTADGRLSDSFDGRLLNPGHAIEAMWFVMDLAERLGRPSLIEQAVHITLNTLEYGWDREYGGIFYFMDRMGHPLQQLEWDQKLWWVHCEALISLLKGYRLTRKAECLEWFEKVHGYTWKHFRDPEHPEWFGYLNRRGEVLLPLKGGKWKGCFHLPRCLYQCRRILSKMDQM